MTISVSTRQVADVSVVDVSGHVTVGGGSNALGEILRDLTSKGHKKILVNLKEVSYIDSSGIGELVSAFTAVTQEGGHLKLFGLSAHVEDKLVITRSHTFFEVYENEAAAVRSFG
jgi:anti-sigma B factor antagonist